MKPTASSAPPRLDIPFQVVGSLEPGEMPANLEPAVEEVPLDFPVEVADALDNPAVSLMRRKGIPASAMAAGEKRSWRELITEHYGVSPQSYVFLCYFPCIPDITAVLHRFDSAAMEMRAEMPTGWSPPEGTLEMMVLEDLKSGDFIRISREKLGGPTVCPL